MRRLRETAGLTQADLADRLHQRGWGSSQQSAVASLERGQRRVGFDDLVRLASVFEVPPQALLVALSSESIGVGGTLHTRDEWHTLMRVNKKDSGALLSALRRRVPERTTSGSRQGTTRSGHKVVLAGRERELAVRAKYSGPTFVSDTRQTVWVPLPSWDAQDRIDLAPGVPHVARDRVEREALLDAATEGRVRRIDRHEARRLRAAKARERNA